MEAAVVSIGSKVILQMDGFAGFSQSIGGRSIVLNERTFRVEVETVAAFDLEAVEKFAGATSGMADNVHDSLIALHTDTSCRISPKTTGKNSHAGPRPAMSEFLA